MKYLHTGKTIHCLKRRWREREEGESEGGEKEEGKTVGRRGRKRERIGESERQTVGDIQGAGGWGGGGSYDRLSTLSPSLRWEGTLFSVAAL